MLNAKKFTHRCQSRALVHSEIPHFILLIWCGPRLWDFRFCFMSVFKIKIIILTSLTYNIEHILWNLHAKFSLKMDDLDNLTLKQMFFFFFS